MKKSILATIIVLIILLVILSTGGLLYLLYYLGFIQTLFPSLPPLGLKQTCGGITGRLCPTNYVCEYDDQNILDNVGICVPEKTETDFGGVVEYDESYGKICPLGVKFLGKKGANPIGCTCPVGYSLENQIIGGEQCYGPGSDCPILSSECKPE